METTKIISHISLQKLCITIIGTPVFGTVCTLPLQG
uniref:Uncharacterized protein n=1 Tax=Anguilla anguilla TaxID=7936 RepID=A0A0E9XVW5_ANGAN